MSNWSHVSAIVRVDHLHWPGQPEVDFTRIFGKQLEFDSDVGWDEYDEHPEHFLPTGSEGSLKMSVWINPFDDAFARYTVSIFGDLRNHDDPDSIVEWFKDKVKPLNIRGACIVVDNEVHGPRTWSYAVSEEMI